MDAKTQDDVVFHKLINKHCGMLGIFLNELHTGYSTYLRTIILQCWQHHFVELAKQSDSPRFDEQYKRVVEQKHVEISDICEVSRDDYSLVMEDEVVKDLSYQNKGKQLTYFDKPQNTLLVPIS